MSAAVLSAPPLLAQEALPVEIVATRMAERTRDLTLTGTVESVDSYAAAFRDGGRVVEVLPEIGDRLAAGDVIARVDPARADAALDAAQAALDAAEASLDQARQQRDRAQALLDRGTGTQASLDDATEAFLTARSAREQAEAQLASARRAAEDTVLRAVEDALVIERSVEPGQVVGAGQPVVTLALSRAREAVFLAPNIAELEGFRGHAVTVSPVDSDLEVAAEISEIAPVVSQNGTVEVTVAIPAADAPAFTIGESVVAETSITEAGMLSVPWTALTASAEGPAVWLVDPDSMKAALRQVTIATYTDEGVSISAGLEEGDLVVGQGAQNVFPGRLLKNAEVAE
ncbi:efflux RND transporter periplasmic adaptor subunit [Aquicoccus sp. SCR17]|nr:efflux RND transporter periplasmic adaptor subunit [Carideicomes alvinocaridis]